MLGIFTGADAKAQKREDNNTKMNGMYKLLCDEQIVKKDSTPEEIADFLKNPKKEDNNTKMNVKQPSAEEIVAFNRRPEIMAIYAAQDARRASR